MYDSGGLIITDEFDIGILEWDWRDKHAARQKRRNLKIRPQRIPLAISLLPV